MNNESNLLLQLISKNKSLNEISSILNLSNKQIHTRLSMLKNNGYMFDREYYYNGETNYLFHNPLKENNIPIIKVPENTEKIKLMLISDTHLGHINDSIKCIDSMYNYCVQEGINIILHAGDFFEGLYDNRKNVCKFQNAEDQISYGIKEYPYDKNILNFILLGNHDMTFINYAGIDIQNIILNRRPDLIPIGYGNKSIILDNYMIVMRHQLQNMTIKEDNNKNRILLYGHSHLFSTNYTSTGNVLNIHIPQLSFVPTSGILNTIPSMIEMTLKIKNNQINQEKLKQFIFDSNNKPICISNINFNVIIKKTDINIEDEKISPTMFNNKNNNSNKSKTDYKNLNQIEKFNARYNITEKEKVKTLVK